MLTTKIVGGRQTGKTTELLKLQEGKTVLLVANWSIARIRAKKSNIPVAVYEYRVLDLSEYDTILIDDLDMFHENPIYHIVNKARVHLHATVTPMIMRKHVRLPWQYLIDAKRLVKLEANKDMMDFASDMTPNIVASQLLGVWVLCE